MNKKVFFRKYGFINLTDKNYIASGGEASVYKYSDYALKIYHDSNKCIDEDKIKELSLISPDNVLKPVDLIYDENKKYIGYAMNYAPDTEPICKLFTKNFKTNNNISINEINELIRSIQETITQIHRDGCLAVDLNEMNILSDKNFKQAIFIDVDSYQTKNFKATAIMESIRDREIINDQWNELSDWFSFAVIIFQLYIGIHPYKGKHPDYKASEWIKRMDNNISVFDPKVSLPSVCESFSIIPPKYLEWFKILFVKGLREPPPVLDKILISATNNIKTKIINSNQYFTVTEFLETDKNITELYNVFGVNYLTAKEKDKFFIYKESNCIKEIAESNLSVSYTNTNNPVICTLNNNKLAFSTIDGHKFSELDSKDYFVDGKKVFSLFKNVLTESLFLNFNNKYLHKTNLYHVSYATKLYQGCIIQDLLAKKYLTFIENGLLINEQIPELEGYRVLEVVRKNKFAVIIAEKNGFYDRFVIYFNLNNTFNINYSVRVTKNIDYNSINFTVLDNGLAILLIEEEKIEVFKDNHTIKIIENAPFNHSMKLFSINNSVYFIDNNKIFSVKLK